MFSTACFVVGVTVHTLDFDAICGLLPVVRFVAGEAQKPEVITSFRSLVV